MGVGWLVWLYYWFKSCIKWVSYSFPFLYLLRSVLIYDINFLAYKYIHLVFSCYWWVCSLMELVAMFYAPIYIFSLLVYLFLNSTFEGPLFPSLLLFYHIMIYHTIFKIDSTTSLGECYVIEQLIHISLKLIQDILTLTSISPPLFFSNLFFKSRNSLSLSWVIRLNFSYIAFCKLFYHNLPLNLPWMRLLRHTLWGPFITCL